MDWQMMGDFPPESRVEDPNTNAKFRKRKPVGCEESVSHRIIEKRRRDRMNNCLADLSRLIPASYLKRGRGRIEKTEIVEMAIKYLRQMQDSSSPGKDPALNSATASAVAVGDNAPSEAAESSSRNLTHFKQGYTECLREAMVLIQGRELLRAEQCDSIRNYLLNYLDDILQSETGRRPSGTSRSSSCRVDMFSDTMSLATSSSGYGGSSIHSPRPCYDGRGAAPFSVLEDSRQTVKTGSGVPKDCNPFDGAFSSGKAENSGKRPRDGGDNSGMYKFKAFMREKYRNRKPSPPLGIQQGSSNLKHYHQYHHHRQNQRQSSAAAAAAAAAAATTKDDDMTEEQGNGDDRQSPSECGSPSSKALNLSMADARMNEFKEEEDPDLQRRTRTNEGNGDEEDFRGSNNNLGEACTQLNFGTTRYNINNSSSNSSIGSNSLPSRLRNPPSRSSSTTADSAGVLLHDQGGRGTHQNVPIFALHPNGVYYVPMSVDPSLMPQGWAGRPLTAAAGDVESEEVDPDKDDEDSVVLHPVTISVNFSGRSIRAKPPKEEAKTRISMKHKEHARGEGAAGSIAPDGGHDAKSHSSRAS